MGHKASTNTIILIEVIQQKQITVKLVLRGHHWDKEKVPVHSLVGQCVIVLIIINIFHTDSI
jgi:hypothetical protein